MLRIVFLATDLASRVSRQLLTPRATNDILPSLKFNDNGTFQMSIFSDMHFGQYESSIGPAQDRNTVRVIGDVLDFDRPELVVLNGDLIDGDSTQSHNSTHYIDQIVAPIVRRNLTWASTYGNHDHSYSADSGDILKREQMWPGARTRNMVTAQDAGTTNYYLLVYPAACAGDGCTPELVLWFFDSRGGFYFQGVAQANWVHASVVTWFNETNALLTKRYQRVIPSLAFVHIPINATRAMQTDAKPKPHYQPGIDDKLAVAQQGEGWCRNNSLHETCDYGGQDEPFMQALVGIPGLMGLFYGHDHGKSWCYRWDSRLPGMDVVGNGLNLCYGQHSGYGGYGDWIRGAREVVVRRDKLAALTVDTYVRLESGAVVGAVTLNSSFNSDRYPATPNQFTYMDKTVNGRVKVFRSGSSRLEVCDKWARFYYVVAWAMFWHLLFGAT
ncbi:hypothetical protein MAC_02152 [Metarhizium acridum CQMa 102]|uniref:Calcineurin-like phosphoesterase domain-containing protein n=1 Tax=Metarhizium acridum (strain CQMa 102) TaxID=655827 RepID=E9DX04_METAQ|nr:uncharacterized protein MAC_02152 [Metarhizium acridum CQMa 102]EFY91867.1 hypothetical protein MAC_02152 [Metarhizium acridum CQMa 102]